MALTAAQKKTVLNQIVKGKNGLVQKEDLTEAKITELQALVGKELDCRFDFTRTTVTQNEDGASIEQEVTENMYCGRFIEADDSFIVERDMLSNYDGTEVYPYGHELAGENILADLQSKELITLS